MIQHIIFGKGYVGVGTGITNMQQAVVDFSVLREPREVGEQFKREEENGTVVTRLIFTNAESIDVVIKALERAKVILATGKCT